MRFIRKVSVRQGDNSVELEALGEPPVKLYYPAVNGLSLI